MANGKRLLSLDILRGLDMFLLTVVGPLFWALNKLRASVSKDWAIPDAVQLQFRLKVRRRIGVEPSDHLY